MIHDALGPIVYRQFAELNIPIKNKDNVYLSLIIIACREA